MPSVQHPPRGLPGHSRGTLSRFASAAYVRTRERDENDRLDPREGTPAPPILYREEPHSVIPTGGCRSGGIAARPRDATTALATSSQSFLPTARYEGETSGQAPRD